MTSPIEKIYKEIFGELPSKSGAAFERLAAIATSLIEEDGSVLHDGKLRGQFSETLYQLDVHHKSEDGLTEKMGEAKDYSERNAKVGRGDIQKLAGALPDLLKINAGTYFSATGYTSPAKKYANNAALITGGKPIELYELKASTEKDEKGFVKTIIVNLHIELPNPSCAKWTPIFTKDAIQSLLDHFGHNYQFSLGLSEFFDVDGSSILTLSTLTESYGSVNEEDDCAHGCYWLPGHYINVDGFLAQICGLEYKVPHTVEKREIRISDDSKHRLVIKNKDGESIRILTDEKLRNFGFNDSGQLIKFPVSENQ